VLGIPVGREPLVGIAVGSVIVGPSLVRIFDSSCSTLSGRIVVPTSSSIDALRFFSASTAACSLGRSATRLRARAFLSWSSWASERTRSRLAVSGRCTAMKTSTAAASMPAITRPTSS
jgi:hypothetical protein